MADNKMTIECTLVCNGCKVDCFEHVYHDCTCKDVAASEEQKIGVCAFPFGECAQHDENKCKSCDFFIHY